MPKLPQTMTLSDLFKIKIKALYDIETRLVKALPKMEKKATNPGLKASFKEHTEQTKKQVQRLEKIFRMMDEKPQKTKVEAIRGLEKDAQWVMTNIRDKQALDATLIGAAQYVEHYEMAGYMVAREWADLLGMHDAQALLEETLEEEIEADAKLQKIASTQVNEEVMMGEAL